MSKMILTLMFLVGFALSASAQKKEQDRLENAGVVMKEILDIPESIPENLLADATCVIVIPSVLKFAFVVGGSYGRGVMTCRGGDNFKGEWGAPSMIALEGGSVGFQAGGQATDFVLLLMNSRSASAILASKVKLGVDVAGAAGPVGRHVEGSLDVSMRAEILSYSRSRGLFAGASLGGSTLRADNKANLKLYGKQLDAKEIVLKQEVNSPPAAEKLLATLNKKTAKKTAISRSSIPPKLRSETRRA
jgi:lipid-binding SYLF domain-containing protein